jgi:hypothetical protein
MKRGEVLRRALYRLLLAVIIIAPLENLFLLSPASAAGETYNFDGGVGVANVLMKGGDVKQTATLLWSGLSGNNLIYKGTVIHKTGCTFQMLLTVPSGSKSGTLTPSGGNCSGAILSGYVNQSISIGAAPPPIEDPLFAVISAELFPINTDKIQPTDTFTLKDSTGKVIQTKSEPHGSVVGPSANSTEYQTKFTGVKPGKYTVCESIYGKCADVTKVINVQGDANFGQVDDSNASANGANAGANCSASNGFTWIICAAIKLIVGPDGLVNTIEQNIIVPFLHEPPLNKSSPDVKPVYNIWSAFKNVASVFFILVFFLIIIGTAAGFDNYTIKKVLPHLVAGAILVPFSWYICAVVIDLGNVLGQGLAALVSPIIGTPNIDLTSDFTAVFGLGTATVLGGFVLAGAAATAGLGSAITLLLAFLTVFFTLILRKILLITLVVLSPFALLAWVLPNTEKWFKMWAQNFFKLVMMYPIIIGLFEAGRLFAATTGATLGDSGAVGTATNFVRPVVQITALILPLFGVAFAFKFAGAGLTALNGAAKQVSGAANKRYGKGSDFDNNRREDAIRNSAKRAKIAENAANAPGVSGFRKAAQNRKAALNWRRAGLAGGSDTTKLKRSAQVGKTAEELGTIGAEKRQGQNGDPEAFVDRLKSTEQSILDRKSDERGARQGVLEGYNSGGRPDARQRQSNARVEARDNYLKGIGTQRDNVAADDLNQRNLIAGNGLGVSAVDKVNAAGTVAQLAAGNNLHDIRGVNRGEIEALDAAATISGLPAGSAAVSDLRFNTAGEARANVTAEAHIKASSDSFGNVQGNEELDAREISAAAALGSVITPQRARSIRMQNLAKETRSKSREQIGLNAASTETRNEIDDEGGLEDMNTLVTGAARLDRNAQIEARTKRSAAANVSAGALPSTREVFETSEFAGSRAFGEQQALVGANRTAMDAAAEREGLVAGTSDANAAAYELSASARGIEVGAQLAGAIGKEHGIVNADTDAHVTGEQHLLDAETNTGHSLANGAGTLVGATDVLKDDVDADLNATLGAGMAATATPAQRADAISRVQAHHVGTAFKVAKSASEIKTRQGISADEGTALAIEQRIDNQHIADEAAVLLASSAAAGVGLSEDMAQEKAKANIASGTASTTRANAAANVRNSVLTAAGNEAFEESGKKKAGEVDDILSNDDTRETEIDNDVDADNESIDKELGELTDAHTAGINAKTIPAGTAAPTRAQVIASRGGARSRADITAARQKRIIDNAGAAARITGQKTRIAKNAQNQKTVDTEEAAIRRAQNADIEKAENEKLRKGTEGYNEAYEQTSKDAESSASVAQSAIRRAAFESAYNREIAASKTPAEATATALAESQHAEALAINDQLESDKNYADEYNAANFLLPDRQKAFEAAFDREKAAGKSDRAAIDIATEESKRAEDAKTAALVEADKIRVAQNEARAHAAGVAAGEVERAKRAASVPAGTQLDRKRAQRAVITATGIAAGESTRRQSVTALSTAEALSKAVVGGSDLTDLELESSVRAKLDNTISETAQIRAYETDAVNRKAQGIADKDYAQKVDDIASEESRKLLMNMAARAAVATKVEVPNADGTTGHVSIGDVELNEPNIKSLINIVRNGSDGDKIAAMDRLSGAGSSQASYDALKTELTGTGKLFGGDIYNTVDAEYKAIWDLGTRSSKHTDASKPPIAAYTSLDANGIISLGYGGMKRALTTYDLWGKDIEEKHAAGKTTDLEYRENKKKYEYEVKTLNKALTKAALNRNTADRVDSRIWTLLNDNDPEYKRPIIIDPATVAAVNSGQLDAAA